MSSARKVYSIFSLFLCSFLFACATPPPKVVEVLPEADSDKKYSSTPNFINTPERKYKRTTRDSMSKEAKLQQEAGSLWVMQGQGSFLFTENNLRMIGDLVIVEIDGEPKKELEAKVETIAVLLRRLRERRQIFEKKQKAKRLAMMKERESKDQSGGGDRTPASEDAPEEEETEFQKMADKALKEFKFDIKEVSTRIKEVMFNGDYKVSGSRGFLIGDKEYRVIINGVVRPNDIEGDGTQSSKLVEASFDIVSTLRKGKTL